MGIFFGAAWSGSCKQFMEPLLKVYNKLVEEKGKSFELVYVPATVPGRPPEDEATFKELLAQMPWLAVPLHRKGTHKKLTRRFQVRQIPMIVLLDADGKTIHRDITPAVTHIIEDAEGDAFADQFPWAEKRHTNIKEMLGDTFLKGDGTEVSISALDGKYIGVLLSASWHWQCRRFQQMLEYMYEKLKGEGKQFEIIDMVSLPPRSLLQLQRNCNRAPCKAYAPHAARKTGFLGGCPLAVHAAKVVAGQAASGRGLPCGAVPHARCH